MVPHQNENAHFLPWDGAWTRFSWEIIALHLHVHRSVQQLPLRQAYRETRRASQLSGVKLHQAPESESIHRSATGDDNHDDGDILCLGLLTSKLSYRNGNKSPVNYSKFDNITLNLPQYGQSVSLNTLLGMFVSQVTEKFLKRGCFIKILSMLWRIRSVRTVHLRNLWAATTTNFNSL